MHIERLVIPIPSSECPILDINRYYTYYLDQVKEVWDRARTHKLAYGPHLALPGMTLKFLKVVKKTNRNKETCDRGLIWPASPKSSLSGPLQKHSV